MNPTKIVFDTDKFMNQLQTYSQALNESLKKDLKSQMEKEINSKISSKKATLNSDTLNKFKKNLTVIKGSTLIVSADALPEDIYKKLITSDKISASDYITMNAFDDSKEFLEQVSNYINAILDSSDTAVNVGGKKYKISRDFGNTVNLATVKDITSDINYIITWDNKNNKNSALETLKDFLKDLVAYEKNSTYRVVKNSLIDLIYAAVDDFIGCFANKNATVQSLSSFLKNSLAGESSTLNSIGYSINKTEEFFKAFFPQTDSGLTQIQKNYKTFAKYEAELEKAVSKLKNPDADTIKNLTAYKNFLSAYETLSGKTLNISPEDYVTYYFKDVHNAEITQSRASIVGTSQVDSIISEGKNSTIYGESGNDALMIEGAYSKVYGGAGKDSIIIAGNNSEAQGDVGDDDIIITGVNVKAEGGYGQDTILIQGSNITVTGDGETFDYLPIGDTFIIDNSARNILITDFEKSADKLQLNFSDIVVDLSFVEGEQSLVILTAGKYEKIAVLQGVSESSFDNITYNGITTSIDWLLENKKFTVKNPYENIIQVKNNKLENTLSGVQIQAESGNNKITNKGSEVTISAGTGNDYIDNYGDNVIINGGTGDDTIYNDDPGDPSAGLNVVINAGIGNDVISNDNSGAIISGGDGDDNITNYGTNVSISGGLGNDVIINPVYADGNGESVTIDAGEGNDTVKNYSSKVTINSGNGDDDIQNNSSMTAIDGGNGNDYIRNYSKLVTIKGSEDNDTITNSGDSAFIDAGQGNDSIINFGTSVTLDCGTGDDYVEHNFDNIYQRTYNQPPASLLLNAYSGNNTIKSGAARGMINGGTKDDYICTKGTSAYLTINGGNGDDEISVEEIANGRIDGGAGKDCITVAGSRIMLDAGEGDDFVYLRPDANYNYFDSTIKAGKGNDVIYIEQYTGNSDYNYYKYFQYAEGDGDDIIYGFHFDRIDITEGEYSTQIENNDVIIKVGTGSITLKDAKNTTYIDGNIFGKKSTITSPVTETAKNISNTKSNTIISGTKYADTISNSASRVTISGGDNKDSITSIGDSVSISGGAGNDTLYSDVAGSIESGSNVTITGGTGNDYISNDSAYSKLEGNDGKDTIINYGWNTTIDGGTDDDIINNFKAFGDEGNKVSIIGGAGNDTINSFGKSVTISGGAGNDKITSNGTLNSFLYSSGDGNDTIFGINSGDTLKITGAEYSSVKSGNDLKIIVGSGSILLKDVVASGIKLNIQGTLEIDSTPTLPSGWKYGNTAKTNLTASVVSAVNVDLTQSYGTNVATVDGSKISTSRTFTGNAKANSIKGGTNADAIYGNAGADTIYGGSGDDKIYGGNDNDKLYGDAGNDSLYGNNGNDTLTGGAGNDTFFYETGNDVITDYVAGTDKIKLVSSIITSSSLSGSDVVLKTSNGNITVQKAKNKNITVIDKNGKETTQIYPTVKTDPTPTLPNGWKADTTGKTVTATVTSAANIDLTKTYGTKVEKVDGSKITKAVSIVGNAKANSMKGGKGADTISGGAGNDTVSLGGGNDVYTYSGGNDVIQDYAAGTDKIKLSGATMTGSSISGSDLVLKVGSGSITVKNGKGKKITVIDAQGKETTQIYPIVEVNPLPNGWKADTTGKTVMATIASAANIDLMKTYGTKVEKVDGSKITKAVSIVGNAKANSMKGGKGADTISGGAGNDTVSLGGGADVYIYSGGNDVIQDYVASTDKIKLSGGTITGSSNSGNDVVLKVGSGSITVKNGKGKKITVINAQDKETTKIYPIVESNPLPSGWKADTTRKTVTATVTSVANIDLTKTYGTKVEKVDGSKITKEVSIVGNAKSNSIKGGKGADTISGGAGNDTVSLGGGADVYTYSGGNDVIQDYAAGADKIKLSGATIIGSSISGSDLVLKVGSGSITVKNGKGKKITVINAQGKETTQIYPIVEVNQLPNGWKADTTGKTVTATVASAANIDLTKTYGTKVEKVDGSKITKAVSIVGNAKANSIKGGKGADTISSGAGNDTVSLGGGADVYIYSGGNDVIQDYAAGTDKIKLSGATITGSSISGSDVVLKVGSGSITVKKVKGKKITVIDAQGKETTQIYPIVEVNPLPNGWKADTTGKTVTATVTSAANIDLTKTYGTKVEKVDGSKITKAVSIVGNAKANSMKGGKGADTISGGAGNDTVSLGGGADVYIYSGGNDVIQDYTFGQDKIKLSSGTISGASISGNDVLLRVGNGSINVKNGKGKNITILDSKGTATVKNYDQSNGKEIDNRYGSGVTLISGGAGNDTIWNAEFFVSINGGAGDDWIDSDADNVTINGGAGNDSILTGNEYVSINGGEGNDWIADYGGYNVTISGGKGNDTIRLGSYYESSHTVIKYASGDGDDVISNVNDNDTLQITGSTYTTMKSGSDVIFKVGNGSITVENGLNSGFNIDFISSNFNNSRTLDLMYDNNFMTNELQIDDISEVSPLSYSVGQIEYSTDNNNIFRLDLIVPDNDCNKK